MGALIRSHDWSTTLGPPEEWPEALKIALRLMLSSGHPMMIWWGPDLIQFYNDAHRRSLPAERHPAALGAQAPVFQPEIREIVVPQVEHVMSGGGATWRENQRVPILRNGRLQETFWTWSYNPIDAPNAPLGVGGIMIICRETTAAVMAERRQSFQLALADCLRDLGDPREVMAAAAELLGRHLGADRVGYSEIDETGEIFTVERDWCAPGAPSLVGARRLNDFGPKLVAALRAGQTVRFEDALTDSLTAGEDVAAAYAAATSRAAITVPLVKSGRFAAAIFAHQRAPRYWTDEDEALVREVAERTWAAVERARAEAALRQSEAHWRGMFDRLHEGFFLAELIRDGNGKAVDWRYIDVNSVWETLTQVPRDRAVGRTIREMHPSALGGWIDLFSQVVETGKSATLTGKGARGDRWYQGQVFRTGPNQFAVLFLDVTERHKVETLLRESEERWRIALESGELGSWELDVETGATHRSPRHDQIFGYDILPDWSFAMFERHVAPEDRADVAESFRAGIASGASWRFACRIDRADGERRWIEVSAKPVADAQGRVARVMGTTADITERRESEMRLKALNESLEREVAKRTADRDRFWRLSSDLMLVVRYDGVIVAVNPAWTTMLGWCESELLGSTIFELIHPEDVEASRSRPAALPEGAMMWRFNNRYRRKNGEYRRIDWTAVPGDGLVNAIGRDITEEKEKTEALERSEARLRSVFETSYQFQGFLTPKGILLDANPVSLAAIQRSLAEIVGQPFPQTPWFSATPGMPEQVAAAVAVVAGGASVRQEIVIDLPTGWRAFDFSMRPVVNSAGAVIGIVPEALEITERRAAEEQLRQSQKMEAVGQLTGGLAHDFNNLLAGIMGSLELLKTRAEQGRIGELERFINSAQGAANRAAALTHRLLAFSRRQTLDPRTTEANRLVEGMVELIERTVGPGIVIETLLAKSLWSTLCDPNQLESALLNLCINARDAMPDGGRLTIATGNSHIDEQAAQPMELSPGDYIFISVADTGAGMAPEILARAFDPFFTTKPIGMGTGLGLSMIYGFARQSGGHVCLSSEVGRGSEAKLYLPRHDGKPEGLPAPAELASAPRARACETVLVVDDEPLVRTLVIEVLKELGYTTLEAADGAGGLKILRSGAAIDLLISDVGLPGGMNGRQMADAARQIRPGLKVLFITGYADSAVIGKGQLEPGMHLITKPFAMEMLATQIRAILATGESGTTTAG